jgi:malonate transporter
MSQVLSQVLPFFLIVAVGWGAARAKLFDERSAEALSAYVFWIGFPSLLIDALSRAPKPAAGFAISLAVYGACGLAILAASLLLGRLLRWPERSRAGAGLAASLGNSAFLGLPLAVALFGDPARATAAGFVAVDFIVVLSIGVFAAARSAGRSATRAVAGVARNPVILGAAVGLLLAATHTVLPPLIAQPLSALAATGSPVALIALGAVLGQSRRGLRRIVEPPVLWASIAKLLILPALVYAGLRLTGAPVAVRQVAVLLAACPTAVNVFIQTKAYGVYPDGAARVVTITTIASAVTLTVLAKVLGG